MADPYVAVEEFKAWVGLGDSIDDATIAKALAAASAAIDKFCATHFWKTAAGTARSFDARNPYQLRIDDAAVVTEVATDPDSDGVFETVWAASDFQLLPLNRLAAPEELPVDEVRAVATRTFPSPVRRAGLVRVTGTWGWAAIPEAVKEATLLTANRLVKRKGSPEGVSGFDEFGVIRISSRDDPDAVRLLTPYRRSRRKGGWPLA